MIRNFIEVNSPNPHRFDARNPAAHPEVKELGPTLSTAVYTLLLVLFQLTLAYFLRSSPFWLLLLVSYLVGAIANHALFVIIHECTHNLVFKAPWANRLLGIFANFPQFFPSAMPFSKYHMLHHTHQSEYDYDPDLASDTEIRFTGSSPIGKTLFLVFFGLIQGLIRPSRLKKVPFLDGWFILNFVVQFSFLGLLYYFVGFKPLFYLFFSTFFGLGLHPLGARWIQEHYVVQPNQETYSYYGPLNKLCFNMGYHNEHHDFMKIPWSRLPRLKKIAPEYYETLSYHRSWTRLLFDLFFDPQFTLNRRVVRPSRKDLKEESPFAPVAQEVFKPSAAQTMA
jgi:sphingolipid delta-4 desaturase